MATWMSEAVKHTTSPAAVVEIDFDSGTRKYSVDYIRPIGSPAYKGNILKLPLISNSIGDLVRTFIYSKIEIIFADTDREFRALITEEGIKNREMQIKVLFIDAAVSITSLTVFVGNIYNWSPMRELRFSITCEQKSKNLENTYPNKVVEATDYANADEYGLGQLIPVPYGEISAVGLSDDGAFPCIFVDPTVDAERHLVGLQEYFELISNGEFDPGTAPWAPGNLAVLASVANGKVGKCLSITENGQDWPCAIQQITVRPGSVYRTHGYVKAGTENEYSVWIYDQTHGNWILTGTWATEVAGDWSTEIETLFTAPAGCVLAWVFLYSRSLNGEAKIIYYDSITTAEIINIPRVYKNGVLQTEGGGNDYTIGYNIIGGGAEGPFVLNGGFDSDTSDWTAGNLAALASVAGGEAGNCLRITEGGSHSPNAWQNIAVVSGSRYCVNGYVKKGTEDEYSVLIGDVSNGGWIVVASWGTETAGDWSTSFSIYFNAPPGCTTAKICLYSRSLNGEGKVIYFDTITCTVIASSVHVTIDWEANNNPISSDIISCDTLFGDRGPVEAWKHFLMSFCEYVDADFHAISHDAAHVIETNRSYQFDGAFVTEKKLIVHEDQVRNEFELDIWREPKDGLIHFKYISSLVAAIVHYRDYLDILKGYEPNTQVTKIINYLKYMYNYNYARTYFYNLPYREDVDSQTKQGAIYRDKQAFYFVRNSSVAADLAARKLLRRKDPIVLDKFPLPLKAFNDNLGDFIEITHFEGKGSEGYEKKVFQLRTTQDNLDNFSRKETLEDVSNYIGKEFIMGPTALPAYTAATAAEREKYGFLCDPETEQYSNGDPAKRLYD